MNYVISEVKDKKREDYVNMNLTNGGDAEKIKAVNSRMLTVNEYNVLARRIIGRWAPEYAKTMMLSSEDAIDYVAHHIMLGDWKFNPDRMTTIKTFRGYCGKRAIQCYLIRLSRQASKRILNNLEDDDVAYNLIVDEKTKQPVEQFDHIETRQMFEKTFSRFISRLKPTQKACVIMYYMQDKKILEISQELGMTKEGVRRSIENGIAAIRKSMGVIVKRKGVTNAVS